VIDKNSCGPFIVEDMVDLVNLEPDKLNSLIKNSKGSAILINQNQLPYEPKKDPKEIRAKHTKALTTMLNKLGQGEKSTYVKREEKKKNNYTNNGCGKFN
jgi:hypothetical protein